MRKVIFSIKQQFIYIAALDIALTSVLCRGYRHPVQDRLQIYNIIVLYQVICAPMFTQILVSSFLMDLGHV